MDLQTPLRFIPGIGPSFAKRLEVLEILKIEDLLWHLPFRYDDFSNNTNVLEAEIDQKVTLRGELWSIKNVYTRSRRVLTQAVFNDGTSSIHLTWFNQTWLIKSLKPGDQIQISGKLTKYKNKLTIVSPVWEKIISEKYANRSLHTGTLVPIYPETLGLTSRWMRTRLAEIFPKVRPLLMDPLPEELKEGMLPLDQALYKIHFPQSYDDINQARERLSFDELFFIQLATQKTRRQWKSVTQAKAVKATQADLAAFINQLPFSLTNAQTKVIQEVYDDVTKEKPMNRLVQGEVGSGKTVVAAAIIYLFAKQGMRSLLMAPTEILAIQHFNNLVAMLQPFGLEVGIYTASRKFTKEKLLSIPPVIIGTHALLSEKLIKENIGLVVIDEQQRFGVQQRSFLRTANKDQSMPHFLTMTATPIPRTVALTLYGDLDLSLIDELPKGRQQVKTFVVPNSKRADAYNFIKKKVHSGDQVYIITPLIEESETLVSVKAAKAEYERLKATVFPALRLGLLHGKLKSKEKDQVLVDFRDKKIDILVSTSVVEVGVDVPNATIMVIEGAERFGLAQLHQLRGRVGRGEKESFCFLFSDSPQGVGRLKNLEKIYNGLELAELDLKIRGSGEIFGTKQSGRWNLKIADLANQELVEKTKNAAKDILDQDPGLDKYPHLKAKLQSLGSDVMPD